MLAASRRAIVAALLATLAATASAAAMPSDDILRRAILGGWVVPADSSDYNPSMRRNLEVFHADGTYTFYSYADDACSRVIGAETVKWAIEQGQLISYLASGKILRDEIVSIDLRGMTLHSLDDGTTYTRIRATKCSANTMGPAPGTVPPRSPDS